MIPLYYDLHLHSCLSPCGDDDMTPGNIVAMASLKGLDVIALTDHNSCKNCLSAIKWGELYNITVIPGMELCTSEEVHIICLFPTLHDALLFEVYIHNHMLLIENREAIFGKQQVLNESDEVIDIVKDLLITSTTISFDAIDSLVSSYHGLWFPAHIDKNSTSLISNLGFIPPDSTFTCVELHDLKNLHHLQKEHPYLKNCNILCNSDAHYLQDIHESKYQLFSNSKSMEDIFYSIKNGPLN
ncbi:MAG: PHP domain-containing protein [Lachnospiraceae bacterium]|nr:PHP domain-containing protein [Lachnospiraceae bacterium]